MHQETDEVGRRTDVKRIVFRTGRGLGDAVLCEPLVRALARDYPDAELTVVLPICCEGIAELGFRGDIFVPWLEAEEFAAFADGFDLAIDADPAQYAGSFHSVRESGTAFICLFAHYRPEAERTTAYERMAEGLARIGVDALGDFPTLRPEASEDAKQAWDKRSSRGETLRIVIHPGSSAQYAHKRWLPEGFAFVADEFLARYDADVVLVGSESERELTDGIRSLMRHGDCASSALGGTLGELAALLDSCELFLGNDSGVGHLAAALGRPTVTIAGPTSAEFWAPLTDRALVKDPHGCCYDPGSCGVRCLRTIRGCEVLGAAEALLTATTKRAAYPCLDPIRLADDLEVIPGEDETVVLRSRLWDMPMTVQRGSQYVMDVLRDINVFGSYCHVRQTFPEAGLLLEQCFRHAILQPNCHPVPSHPNPHTTKENICHV
jgi:ADP-heptose:LPS heptosyltransferase